MVFCQTPKKWWNQQEAAIEDDNNKNEDEVYHNYDRLSTTPTTSRTTPKDKPSFKMIKFLQQQTPSECKKKGGLATEPSTISSSTSPSSSIETPAVVRHNEDDRQEWIPLDDDEEETPKSTAKDGTDNQHNQQHRTPPSSAIKSRVLDFDAVASFTKEATATTSSSTMMTTTTTSLSPFVKMLAFAAVFLSIFLANHPEVIPPRLAKTLPIFLQPSVDSPCCSGGGGEQRHQKAAVAPVSKSLNSAAAVGPNAGVTSAVSVAPAKSSSSLSPSAVNVVEERSTSSSPAALVDKFPISNLQENIRVTPGPSKVSSISTTPAKVKILPSSSAAKPAIGKIEKMMAINVTATSAVAAATKTTVARTPTTSATSTPSSFSWGKLWQEVTVVGPEWLLNTMKINSINNKLSKHNNQIPKVQFFPGFATLSQKIQSHVQLCDATLKQWSNTFKQHKVERRRQMMMQKKQQKQQRPSSEHRNQPSRRQQRGGGRPNHVQ
jgi:hypothetical protein